MGSRKLTSTDWQKFRRLSRAEKTLLLQAAALIPFIAVGQRWISVKRLRAGLSYISVAGARTSRPSLRPLSADEIARVVQIAADRGILRPTCLPHALVLWALLRRHGIDAEIYFGVRRAAGGIDAHAWVAHGDTVLNDVHDVSTHFAPFPAQVLPGA